MAYHWDTDSKEIKVFKIPSSPPQQNRHKIPRGGFYFLPWVRNM